MNSENSQDKRNQEAQLLFESAKEDLRYAKTRQWQIIYYALLTYAAIITFYLHRAQLFTKSYYEEHEIWYGILLLIPALVTNLASLWLIIGTHASICVERLRFIRIAENCFEPAGKTIVGPGVQKDEKETRFLRDFWWITLPFIILIVFGLFLVAWAIFKDMGAIQVLSYVILVDLAYFVGCCSHQFHRFENFKKEIDSKLKECEDQETTLTKGMP